jgi:hypothetical protein
MDKLKVLWFGLVPIGWWLAFEVIKWGHYYPIDCKEPNGICIFIFFTQFFGSIAFIGASIGLAIYLQD